jgi:signal transduction histidine kinase
VIFLVLAAGIGAVGGAAILHGWPGFLHGWLCLGAALLAGLWPLAWMATMRIAWPLHHLATIANKLHGGQLQSREQLPEGPGEVGEVSHALKGMADRLARQLQHQRSLMAAVSHELRSPLGRVRVLVELAREGAASDTVYDELQAEVDAMDQLVGDLLAAARIDFEAISLAELDPKDCAKRALELAKFSSDKLVVDGAVSPIQADPTLLARALVVLLDNARRYGGAEIRLVLRQREHWLRFAVEDNGPGFKEGDLQQIFQPFYRGSVPKKQGEGLGLALVRQIAEAHQGEAGAENRREGGARVWLELPV